MLSFHNFKVRSFLVDNTNVNQIEGSDGRNLFGHDGTTELRRPMPRPPSSFPRGCCRCLLRALTERRVCALVLRQLRSSALLVTPGSAPNLRPQTRRQLESRAGRPLGTKIPGLWLERRKHKVLRARSSPAHGCRGRPRMASPRVQALRSALEPAQFDLRCPIDPGALTCR